MKQNHLFFSEKAVDNHKPEDQTTKSVLICMYLSNETWINQKIKLYIIYF